MQYIHVKSLDKFHPGYKDRTLLWAKINICMVQGDPEMEMIENETDKWRFVCFILLELQAQKPIPLNDDYFRRKGFDLKKRPISLTIKMLHNFLDIVTSDVDMSASVCAIEKNREEENRGEESALAPSKIKHLDFVLLKAEEYQALVSDYGSTVIIKYISSLNSYIGSKGKKYKSHYHTILNWLGRDQIKKKPKETNAMSDEPRWQAPDGGLKKLINSTVDKMGAAK